MQLTHTNKRLNVSIINTLLIIVALTYAYAFEIKSLHQLWVDSYTYTHGYLVLALSLYLLYKLPVKKILSNAQPSIIIGIMLLFTAIPFLLAKAGDIKTIQLFLFPFIILFSLGSYLGLKSTIQIAFPILILLFSVPVWDDLSPIFQAITVAVNQVLLWVFNIPAKIDGLFISLPVGTFFVAGGCSGVKYILVALLLSSVYSYLYLSSYKERIFLIVTALALSMLSNWIRVFGIIVAGHLTDMESSLINDHEWWGWLIFFAFTLLPLYFISQKIELQTSAIKQTVHTEMKDQSGLKLIASTLIIIAIVIAPSLLLSSNTKPSIDLLSVIHPPKSKSNWVGPLYEIKPWNTQFINPDAVLNGSYIKNNNEIHLSVNYYHTQTQGKELIYYQNKFYNEDNYSLLKSSIIDIQSPAYIVNELLLKGVDDTRVIIWYWYLIGNKTYSNPLKVKLAGAINRIGGSQAGTWLSISSPCTTDKECTERREQMTNFIQTFESDLKVAIKPN